MNLEIDEKMRQITGNKYEAIIIAAKLARELNTRRLAELEQQGPEAIAQKRLPKVTVEALNQLASGKVKHRYREEQLVSDQYYLP